MRVLILLLLAAAGALLVQAQGSSAPAPISSNPIVELKGAIKEVSISPGKGMPYFTLSGEKGATRVVLGSMRYLMTENFNPKAGEPAEVRGYQVGDSITAISVKLPNQKTSIRLRDEQGRPLWRGGPGGRRHQGGRQ